MSKVNKKYGKSARDVMEVYSIAERHSLNSCIPIDSETLRCAFQLVRYAFREWACNKSDGVVLRMLRHGNRGEGEVGSYYREMVIQCEDNEKAEAIAQLLREDGYVEEKGLSDS